MPGADGPPKSVTTLTEANLGAALPGLMSGVAARMDASVMCVAFQVAGVSFACHTSDSDYAAILRRAFRTLPDQSSADIRVLADPGQGGRVWPRWGDPFFRERSVEAALDTGPFRFHYFDRADFWQVFDRAAGLGLQLMVAPGAYPDWEPGSPLRNFIHWGLIERGSGLIHAGTLASGGRGVLLAGAGGSGKSGTVLAGLLNGLQTVGDDYVAVTSEGGIAAHLVFNGLKQDPAGFARLGLTGRMAEAAPLNWQGKHVFTMQELGLPEPPDKIAIRALCLPRITGAARTRFAPIAQREAFLALAPSSVTQIPSARGESFRLSAQVARDLPAWRVELGTDPAEIAQAFGAFIEDLGP